MSDAWDTPLLTLFVRGDPVLGAKAIQAETRDTVPGARGLPHHACPDATRFVQEDEGPPRAVNELIAATPIT